MLALVNRLSYARILVAEDDLVSREIIVKALTKAGFGKIETASDGAEALKKTYNLTPDLVILDLKMPNLDGFQYCERVRNDSALPRMPIIVQTALDDRASKLRALSSGADDFLNKPIDMEEINLRVCNQLSRYFSFKEMQETYSYINMELQQLRKYTHEDQTDGTSQSLNKILTRHCEILEAMPIISSFQD